MFMASPRQVRQYNLAGATAAHFNIGDSNAYFRVNSNGITEIGEYAGAASWVQVNAATDWVIPNSGSGAPHWVRMTRLPASDTVGFNGTLGTWLATTSTRSWGYTITVGERSGTYTCEIALDSLGANVVASGTITLSAEAST